MPGFLAFSLSSADNATAASNVLVLPIDHGVIENVRARRLCRRYVDAGVCNHLLPSCMFGILRYAVSSDTTG